MLVYHFVLRNEVNGTEHLGYMPLADDAEAMDFGQETIRLILLDHGPEHPGSIMEITQGHRAVCCLPFESMAPWKQEKYG